MGKLFRFTAETLNGEILEFPQTYEVACGQLQSVGQLVIRAWDVNDCIVVRRVWGVMYGKNLLGTTQIKSEQDYRQFVSANCDCCFESDHGCNDLFINGCALTINNCFLKIIQ